MPRRLIDADAVEKVLTDLYIKRPLDSDRWVIAEIKKGIMDLQTIDAEPVRHGKWIDEGQPDDFFPHRAWRCSECGEQVLEIGEPWYKYCPNCGADMRGEQDG